MAKTVWIIEATDHNGDRWVVRAENEETADHLRSLFQSQDYFDVHVSRVEEA